MLQFGAVSQTCTYWDETHRIVLNGEELDGVHYKFVFDRF